jgi:hypothetical protein
LKLMMMITSLWKDQEMLLKLDNNKKIWRKDNKKLKVKKMHIKRDYKIDRREWH